MIWTVCFFLSLSLLLFALLIPLLRVLHRRRGYAPDPSSISPFHMLIAGVFVAIVPLFVPIYDGLLNESYSWLKVGLLSIHNAIRLFVIDADYAVIMDNLAGCPVGLEPFFSSYAAILFLLAPLLTFGFVLSFFKNIIAYVRYCLSFSGEAYLFTELNEISLTLAADLRKNHPAAAVVFTDVFDDEEEETQEFIERAKALNAILFRKDITAVDFAGRSKRRRLFFFAISGDESENLRHAVKLIDRYGNRDNTNLYVFSTSVEGEMLLAGTGGRAIHVRRVNEVNSLINRILYTEADKIFRPEGKTKLPPLPVDPDGKKAITAVVVGLGRYGTAMLRALPWYGQMEGYRIELHAFDRDPLAEERFAALCPELMDHRYNGVTVPGEAAYTLRIHSGITAGTKAFADAVKALTGTTYVFVSLGADRENVRMAVELRTLFEQMHIRPVIQAVLHNADEASVLAGITNYRGQPYGLDFVGDLVSSYSEAVILDSELEADALKGHLKWGKEEEFWCYEYNYRSSVASAIHRKARRTVGLSYAAKTEEDLTEEERHALEVLEHCRWNAYMRSEGYVYSGSPDKSSRNDLGKMHHDLVVYDKLSDEEKRKDSSVGTA